MLLDMERWEIIMTKRRQLIIAACSILCMLSAVIPSAATEQPGGAWVLQSAQATGVNVYENSDPYPSHEFSLYDGGFTGYMKWQSGKDSGTVSFSASWTGFGNTLFPGDMTFTCSLSTQASQTAGYRNVGNQLWVYFDYAKQTDDIKNNGSTDQPIPPRNETLTLRVPGGKVGQTMKVRVICSNTGGYGEFVYTYVFQETVDTGTIIPVQSVVPPKEGDAPDEPKAGIAGDTVPLPTSERSSNGNLDVTPAPDKVVWIEGNPVTIVSPAQDSGVKFSDLAGEVEINICLGYDADGKEVYDPEAWDSAELDSSIPIGSHIKTQENSSAILSFADMTTFVMKPETEIVISNPSAKDSQLKLLGGQLWINIKKMMKDGSMDIEMSQAVAGGRGTIFVCEETGTSSKVSVLESKVIFTSKVDGSWEEVLPGETLTATSKGLGRIEPFDVTAEAEAWGFILAEMR